MEKQTNESDVVKPVDEPTPLPAPEQPVTYRPGMYGPKRHLNKAWKIVGIVVLCFVAGCLGSLVMLESGLVKGNGQTDVQNRTQTVVQEGQLISDVSKRVSQSAVSITTQGVAASGQGLFSGTTEEEGAGSGIIISKDGYVLTNKHVVPSGTKTVNVTLYDGTVYKNVKVIGSDPTNDIAFLKIDGVSNLTPAALGDSSGITVGTKVIAIGNALGQFQNTVTSGIISGVGRPLQAGDEQGTTSETLENLFQTDAAINPGNSGGPLVDFNGDVIGINTAVAQDAQGIGFAIPINQAKGLIKSVLTSGKTVKPYLGVRYISIDASVADQDNLPVKQGAYVIGDSQNPAVVQGSPADKAGLREKDIITKVNDTNVDAQNTLSGLLAQFSPGDTVQLTVLRDGKTQTVSVKLDQFSQ